MTQKLVKLKRKLLINNKYINIRNFGCKITQANLASKNDIANFVKRTDFDNKFKSLIKMD